MDREAIARARRRMQADEHLEAERERETALRDALEERIAEADGPAVDERVLATISPEQAKLVRDGLSGVLAEEPADEEPFWGAEEESWEEPADPESLRAELEEEIARLQGELDACRARQQAYEAYLAALGDVTGTDS